MLGSRLLDTIRTRVRGPTRGESQQAQLSRATEHLAEGQCVFIQMEFSRIATYIIRVDDNLYSTDDQGRCFTHLTEEKLTELVCSSKSTVAFVPRTMFPLAADELRAKVDRHQRARLRVCDACSELSAQSENGNVD